MPRSVLQRYQGNPLLTAEDFPVPVNAVFNAGVIKHQGVYFMLTRVEDLRGVSLLWMARSQDGCHFHPDPLPAMLPAWEEPYCRVEKYGIEDPRIVLLEDAFLITYVGYSEYDPLTLLARTRDFQTYERLGLVTLPENKDVVLFPEKIGGLYARLDRPATQSNDRGNIWASFSPDLRYWGDYRPVMTPRPARWDSLKIGPGAPPIKTPQGWLEIYHGVKGTAAGSLYRLGAVLLDLEQPWRVIGRAREAILAPFAQEDYLGDVGSVVFTCGAVLEEDGELKIYYGAADQRMCLATGSAAEIIQRCLEGGPDGL